MAKRFTDSGKWKKEFIKGLSLKMKLLWFYILDDCDHAGIWEVDLEVAGLRIGESVSYEEAFIALGPQIRLIGKNKWFIEDFVFFQYGKLNPANRLHQSVISILEKHGIKDLTRTLEGPKVQVQGQGNGQGEGKEGVQGEPIEEVLTGALDEIYLDQEQIKWPHLDFNFEVETFKNKVRGSPDDYTSHDRNGIRKAFQYQLRNAKKKINGSGKQINKGTEHAAGLMEALERNRAKLFKGGGS